MKNQDMKHAFGQIDPAFERRALQTLDRLNRQEETKVKKKASFSLVMVAVMLVAMAGLAYAASHMGIADYLRDRLGLTDTQRAEIEKRVELPEQQIISNRNEYAQFNVKEALFDGKQVRMLLEVIPNDDVMIIMTDSMVTDSMSDLGPAFKGNEQTIEDYAKEHGKTKIFGVNASTVDMDDLFMSSFDFNLQENGTMHVYIGSDAMNNPPTTLPIKLSCILHEPAFVSEAQENIIVVKVGEDGDVATVGDIQGDIIFTSEENDEVTVGYTEPKSAEETMLEESNEPHEMPLPPAECVIEFTLNSEPISARAFHREPYVFEQTGVQVDEIRVKDSGILTYIDVFFRVVDEQKYNDINMPIFRVNSIDGDPIALDDMVDAGGTLNEGSGQFTFSYLTRGFTPNSIGLSMQNRNKNNEVIDTHTFDLTAE